MITKEYLQNNEKYKDLLSQITIDDCTIDNIINYEYYNYPETIDICNFISKFNRHLFNDKIPIVNDADIPQLIALYECSNNHLFNAYLISLLWLNPKSRANINLESEMFDICSFIIQYYQTASGYLPFHFFTYFYNYFISNSFNKQRKKFFFYIYNELIKLNNVNAYAIASYKEMIDSAILYNFISADDFEQTSWFYLKDLEDLIFKDITVIEEIEGIVDLVISKYKDKKSLKLNLAHFLFNNINIFSFTLKQEKLVKAVKILEEIGDPNSEVNRYKLILEEINKDILSKIEPKYMPFPKGITDKIIEERRKFFDINKSISNLHRFLLITMDLEIITQSDLKSQIDIFDKNSVFLSFVKTQYLDRDGYIITNDHLPEEKRNFIFKAGQHIDLILETYYKNKIDSFFYYFKYDEDIDLFLDDILSKSLISDPNRQDYLKKIIKEILNNNIDTNLRNLISELENGMRYFFNSNGISTREYKAGKLVNVDFNGMLKDVPNNQFRNLLLEYLDDDFVFILEYLMILSPGGNIRNDVMHGNMDPEEMKSYKCYYLFFLILKLYIGFHFCKLDDN